MTHPLIFMLVAVRLSRLWIGLLNAIKINCCDHCVDFLTTTICSICKCIHLYAELDKGSLWFWCPSFTGYLVYRLGNKFHTSAVNDYGIISYLMFLQFICSHEFPFDYNIL